MRNSKLKQIKKLGESKDISSKELFEIYDVYNDGMLNMQSVLIDKRLKIQELITNEEWKQLVENVVLPSEKAKQKIEKQEGKEDDKIENLIQEIEDAIIKEIIDPGKRQNLINSLKKFSATLHEFIDEGQKMNFEDSEFVRDKYANRDDLENFYIRQNELRHQGIVEYFQLQDAAIKYTNENEWKEISKTINSIVKS